MLRNWITITIIHGFLLKTIRKLALLSWKTCLSNKYYSAKKQNSRLLKHIWKLKYRKENNSIIN